MTSHAATVTDLARSEYPNAVCAICYKHGHLRPATAIRAPGSFVTFFVCAGHAERARVWDRSITWAVTP